MKILITGVAGYLGSILAEKLLQRGEEVAGVDNFFHDNKSCINHLFFHPSFSFLQADVQDKDRWYPLLPAVDIVFPLAALVGAPLCTQYPALAYETNANQITLLAQECRAKNHKCRIIYPNTNSGYGTNTKETCTEETAQNPISDYGKSKCIGEVGLHVENSAHTVLRLATVFGHSYRPRYDLLVNFLTYNAVIDRVNVIYQGNFLRNYISVQDVIRGFIWAMDNPSKTAGEVFNLGNDYLNMTKLACAKKVAECVPHDVLEMEFGKDQDQRNYRVSSQKIYDRGFECQDLMDTEIARMAKVLSVFGRQVNRNY